MEKNTQRTLSAAHSESLRIVAVISGQAPQIYQEGLALQQQLFDVNLTAKSEGRLGTNTLMICEHEPVYTLGKSGLESNMLFNPEAVGATLHRISRGGDITFHGPGQVVVYPIFDLETLGIGIRDFVHGLEEVVIRTIAHYGLSGSRIDSASGVWLTDGPIPRKICAIGLRVSRHCTMHGIAVNINTDLKYFSYIVPCGLQDKGVTSLQNELGHAVDMQEVKDIFIREFQELFQVRCIE